MKTIIVCLMLIAGTLLAGEKPVIKLFDDTPIPSEAFWVKSEVGMWKASYNVWYKVDKKNSSIKYSYNKRKWKDAIDAVWHDNHGMWYCISQNKMMSSENGKKWIEVSNRSWQDVSGIWFRFDKDFNLYEVVQ
jgi:hypothetical protein